MYILRMYEQFFLEISQHLVERYSVLNGCLLYGIVVHAVSTIVVYHNNERILHSTISLRNVYRFLILNYDTV